MCTRKKNEIATKSQSTAQHSSQQQQPFVHRPFTQLSPIDHKSMADAVALVVGDAADAGDVVDDNNNNINSANDSLSSIVGSSLLLLQPRGGIVYAEPELPAASVELFLYGFILLVIISVFRFKALHSAINFLISGLATADLMVALFVMPYAVYVYIQGGYWLLGPTMCNLYTAMDVACSTASITLLALISFDRYQAISHPIQYASQSRNVRRVVKLFAVVWVYSFLVASPIVLGFNDPPVELAASPFECRFYNAYFSVLSSLVSFVVPCCVVVFVYVRIIIALRRREKAAQQRRAAIAMRHGGGAGCGVAGSHLGNSHHHHSHQAPSMAGAVGALGANESSKKTTDTTTADDQLGTNEAGEIVSAPAINMMMAALPNLNRQIRRYERHKHALDRADEDDDAFDSDTDSNLSENVNVETNDFVSEVQSSSQTKSSETDGPRTKHFDLAQANKLLNKRSSIFQPLANLRKASAPAPNKMMQTMRNDSLWNRRSAQNMAAHVVSSSSRDNVSGALALELSNGNTHTDPRRCQSARVQGSECISATTNTSNKWAKVLANGIGPTQQQQQQQQQQNAAEERVQQPAGATTTTTTAALVECFNRQPHHTSNDNNAISADEHTSASAHREQQQHANEEPNHRRCGATKAGTPERSERVQFEVQSCVGVPRVPVLSNLSSSPCIAGINAFGFEVHRLVLAQSHKTRHWTLVADSLDLCDELEPREPFSSSSLPLSSSPPPPPSQTARVVPPLITRTAPSLKLKDGAPQRATFTLTADDNDNFPIEIVAGGALFSESILKTTSSFSLPTTDDVTAINAVAGPTVTFQIPSRSTSPQSRRLSRGFSTSEMQIRIAQQAAEEEASRADWGCVDVDPVSSSSYSVDRIASIAGGSQQKQNGRPWFSTAARLERLHRARDKFRRTRASTENALLFGVRNELLLLGPNDGVDNALMGLRPPSCGTKKPTAKGSFTSRKVGGMRASLKRKVKKSQRKEKRATKTLGIVVGTFLICWLPFFALNILNAICAELAVAHCQVGFGPFFYSTWVGYMNSFMNPVIYTIFNAEFRKAFKSLLLGRSPSRGI